MKSNKPRENDALFELSGRVGVPVDSGKPKPEMPVAYGFCPLHSNHNPMANGLIRSGKHLVYKVHYFRTHAGTLTPCQGSGARLCEVGVNPAAHETYGTKTPTCPCETPS